MPTPHTTGDMMNPGAAVRAFEKSGHWQLALALIEEPHECGGKGHNILALSRFDTAK